MPHFKLTQENVDNLAAHPTKSQVIHWDTELPRFGVMVSGKRPTKAYVVQGVVDGKSKRTTIGREPDMRVRKARKEALKLIAEFRNGRDPTQPRVSGLTVRQGLEMYLRSSPNLRASSVKSYRNVFDQFFLDWLEKPLASISRIMCEEKHRSITELVAGRRQRLDVDGRGSANGAMRCLRAVYNFAVDRDPELPANPVRLKRQWHKLEPRRRHLRTHEFARFYRAVRQLPNQVIADYLLLLMMTGMRRSEAASLRWTDIDFEGRSMTLPPERTKTKKLLALPLTSHVFELLHRRLAIGNAGGWVFPASSRSGHIEEPGDAFDKIKEATGIRISSHDLRRSYATEADACRLKWSEVQALINHSLGRSVTAGYVQTRIERLREPAQQVADRIMELCQNGSSSIRQ